MKKNQALALALTAVTVSSLAGLAFAGQKTEEIQGRQDIQSNQIQEGVQSGSLTNKEADKLIKGQDKINQTAQKALSDDKLTRREQHKLEKLQNKESEQIEKKEDNSQKTTP